jgi:crossover junction endodeoxyribonuclease RuvC
MAVLLFRDDRFEVLHVSPFLTLQVSRAGSVKSEIDLDALRQAIAATHPDSAIYVEQVGSMPGQGVSSMFTFGRALGQLEGTLAAFQRGFERIRPQDWKKRFGLGDEKKESMAAAARMWPSRAGIFRAERGVRTQEQAIACAEAALIGVAGHERALARIGKNLRVEACGSPQGS